MKLSSQYPITKYKNGIEEEVLDEVVMEHELTIFVNDQLYKKILCSPDDLEALVIGELMTEKIMATVCDFSDISMSEDLSLIKVLVNKESIGFVDIENKSHVTIPEGLLDQDKILTLFQSFVSSSDLFKSTGGVHSCAILDANGIVYQKDDISRQNAINKVLGLAYLNHISLEDKLLFTTCRISSEIMKKVIHSGIKVLVSKSAPTNVAIMLANKNGISLYGFARGKTMNKYS